MALPIPIVVDNFANYYSEQKKLEAQELKREAEEKEKQFRANMRESVIEGVLDTIAMDVGGDKKVYPKEKNQISFK